MEQRKEMVTTFYTNNVIMRRNMLELQLFNKPMDPNQKKSLERFCTFIIENTDIHYISFLTDDILIDYLKFHKKSGFQEITFTQAIKDIKTLINVIQADEIKKCNKHFDLSIQNFHFWAKL
ncbi:hypothetical protein [Cytobacillus praedii]|uniref:hypothetical protein n=1 Tax=Cytobacillus praedii TaxID=1742358 RepID=UPI002E2350C3|nr:hypothetical protein [Cytobacillus praedii]